MLKEYWHRGVNVIKSPVKKCYRSHFHCRVLQVCQFVQDIKQNFHIMDINTPIFCRRHLIPHISFCLVYVLVILLYSSNETTISWTAIITLLLTSINVGYASVITTRPNVKKANYSSPSCRYWGHSICWLLSPQITSISFIVLRTCCGKCRSLLLLLPFNSVLIANKVCLCFIEGFGYEENHKEINFMIKAK